MDTRDHEMPLSIVPIGPAFVSKFPLEHFRLLTEALVSKSTDLAKALSDAEASIPKADAAKASSYNTAAKLAQVTTAAVTAFSGLSATMQEHAAYIGDYATAMLGAIHVLISTEGEAHVAAKQLADLEQRVQTLSGQVNEIANQVSVLNAQTDENTKAIQALQGAQATSATPTSPGLKRRKTDGELKPPTPYIPAYDMAARLDRLRKQLGQHIQSEPDAVERMAARVVTFFTLHCLIKFPDGQWPVNMTLEDFETFCRGLHERLPSNKQAAFATQWHQAARGTTWTLAVAMDRLLRTFGFVIEQASAGMKSMLNSWSIKVQKDYAENAAVFYNHIAFFWELTITRDNVPAMKDALLEREVVARFVDSIKPEHCDLRVVLKDHIKDKNMNLGPVIDKFKYLIQTNPNLRVNFPFSMPRDAEKYARAVKYKLVPHLPMRNGQGAAESECASLFCEVCYEMYHAGSTRVHYTSHLTEFCVFVLGQWDPWNPACNPGPRVVERPEYFQAIVNHHRRKEGEPSHASTAGSPHHRGGDPGQGPSHRAGYGRGRGKPKQQQRKQQPWKKRQQQQRQQRQQSREQQQPDAMREDSPSSSGGVPKWKGTPFLSRPLE